MNTAVFSVVYPGVERYLPDFLNSLANQSDRDFTLFLINDNVEDKNIFFMQFPFSVRIKSDQGSPSSLRKAGIEWLKHDGIKWVIFADADDYFSINRVETSKKMLITNDLVFNELVLFGEEIPRSIHMLKNFYKEEEKITNKELVNYNCLGMTNTAVRVDKIPEKITEIPDSQIAFDWALFSLILHSGARAVFTKKAKTWYRQYGDNIASPSSFNDEQILRGVRVKQDHYCLLSQWYVDYNGLADDFTQLVNRIDGESLMKEEYCAVVRKQCSNNQRWWEPIKLLRELI